MSLCRRPPHALCSVISYLFTLRTHHSEHSYFSPLLPQDVRFLDGQPHIKATIRLSGGPYTKEEAEAEGISLQSVSHEGESFLLYRFELGQIKASSVRGEI